MDRFWSKVDKTAPNGCWLWVASKTSAGYGKFVLNGRLQSAHRVSYELIAGPIPKGMDLDHWKMNTDPSSCSKACCNPEHLQPVTRAENIRRSPRHRAAVSRNGSQTGRQNGIKQRKHDLPEGLTFTSGGKAVMAQIGLSGKRKRCLGYRRPVTREHIAELSDIYQKAREDRLAGRS